MSAMRLLKAEVQERLARCTEAQQDLFHRMYPDGPSYDQMERALDQIERTITKNERNGAQS